MNAAPKPAENPTGLLAQWRLLCAIIDAPWSTALDHRVARHVIDRYVPKFGQARVSSRFLVQATGARRQNVIDSLRRLSAGGAIAISRPGIGTRPTEYTLNFAFVSSGPVGEATNDNESSGPADETTSGPAQESTRAASGPVQGTESCLPEPADKPAYGISRDAAPAVPPAVAADAAPAAAGRDGFEDFWAAYPRKYQRAKAKAAWQALAPIDREPAIAGASAYADYCQHVGKDAQYMKQPANWLAGECWLEDPTAGFAPQPAARSPAAERPVRKTKAGRPASIKGGTTDMPVGEHLVEVVEFKDCSPFASDSYIELRLREVDGEGSWAHNIHVFAPDLDEEAAGQDCWRTLRTATSGEQVELGQRMWARVGSVVTYRAA